MMRSPLEDEVVKLSNEVARLQIMVERCVEANNQHYSNKTRTSSPSPSQQHQQQKQTAFSSTASSSPSPNSNQQQQRSKSPFAFSAPSDPLAALPSLFSGKEGTARLFRVLVESYPWLLEAGVGNNKSDMHSSNPSNNTFP